MALSHSPYTIVVNLTFSIVLLPVTISKEMNSIYICVRLVRWSSLSLLPFMKLIVCIYVRNDLTAAQYTIFIDKT